MLGPMRCIEIKLASSRPYDRQAATPVRHFVRRAIGGRSALRRRSARPGAVGAEDRAVRLAAARGDRLLARRAGRTSRRALDRDLIVRRRVLVTGGTGFVGANLVRRLLADGHEVHLLLRPGSATAWRLDGVARAVERHRAALEDRGAVERAVRRVKPEWIFHLAAHGAYSWETDLDRILVTNVLGTVNLVRACLRVGFDAFVNA